MAGHIVGLIGLLAGLIGGISGQCIPSVTTASGYLAPGQICSGDLIFSDDFDSLDYNTWNHELTTTGGPGIFNGEFQAYVNNPRNSFAEFGHFTIRPTLENGDSEVYSARVTTENSFRFKYGKIEINAQMPKGDWLWTALWMMPFNSVYGGWPRSGEVDVTESRGNAALIVNGQNIGVEQAASTLHFGPDPDRNAWFRTRYEVNPGANFGDSYHKYTLEWTEEHLKFSLDDQEIGTATPTGGGFWELGQFGDPSENLWGNGGHMAPFDQEFYIILCLAIGGTNGYFPDADAASNPYPKPWSNTQPQQEAFADFLNAKDYWRPTWNMDENNGDQSSLKIDYVRVYAL